MTPVWIFPAYPLLVIGPHASVLAPKLPPNEALQMIIGGVIFQGIGFMVSLMIYAAFIYRLMTQKLPQESLRPGMFISVGPSGFTIAGLIGMGQRLPEVVPKDFMGDGELAGRVSKILANWVGLWLWGLALWFFFVSVFAHWSTVKHNRWRFAMTWYSPASCCLLFLNESASGVLMLKLFITVVPPLDPPPANSTGTLRPRDSGMTASLSCSTAGIPDVLCVPSL